MTDLLASNPGFQNVCKPAKIRRRARGDRRRVLRRVKVFTVDNQRSFNQQRGSWPLRFPESSRPEGRFIERSLQIFRAFEEVRISRFPARPQGRMNYPHIIAGHMLLFAKKEQSRHCLTLV
jgi:hypothetical protein